MSKSIAIIARINKSNKTHSGVWNKLEGISSSFYKLGWDVDLFAQDQENVIKNDHPISQEDFINAVSKEIVAQEYQLIWVRHAIFGREIISFLRTITKENSAIQVLYEIPTYPYVNEFSGWKKYMVQLHAKTIMNKLHKYVDYIVSPNKYDSLFYIPVIHLPNGVNSNNYRCLAKKEVKKTHVNLIAIGTLWDWFGLDRIIQSIKRYEGPYSIHLHILGSGVELNKLEAQAKDGLDQSKNKISFYNWKRISDLHESAFINAIGIGTLAAHRKGLEDVYSLKHREYASCGLPFIYAGSDPEFIGKPFAYQIPSDESIINLSDLISSLEYIPEEIRQFAIDELDWTAKIKLLLDNIEFNS